MQLNKSLKLNLERVGLVAVGQEGQLRDKAGNLGISYILC